MNLYTTAGAIQEQMGERGGARTSTHSQRAGISFSLLPTLQSDYFKITRQSESVQHLEINV